MLERRTENLVPHRGGFNALEVMGALAIFSIVTSFAAELPRSVLKRERLKSAAREIHSLVLATRMEAVKRNRNVVLHVDLANRQITSWAESSPPNFVQDPGEKTIATYRVPGSAVFRGLSGPVDGPDAVAFDTYAGDRRLADRIAFQGDGTVVSPQAENSRPPGRPRFYGPEIPSSSVACAPSGCRGIFLSDRPNGSERNLFRVSVDDAGYIGRVSLMKWVPAGRGGNPGEADFVPSPWGWID